MIRAVGGDPLDTFAAEADRLRLEVQLLDERLGRFLDAKTTDDLTVRGEIEGLAVQMGRAAGCLRRAHIALEWLKERPQALKRRVG